MSRARPTSTPRADASPSPARRDAPAPRVARAASVAALVLLAAVATACGSGKVGGGGGPAVLRTVEVLPADAAIAKGQTRAYSATGHYSDGSTRDLTATATWSAADPTVASATGNVLRGLRLGSTQVRATVTGVTGATGVTVSAPVVTAVTVAPATSTVAAGTTARLTAAALYSDGTRQDATASASWSVTPGAVAAVAGPGAITGTSAGAAVVTATVSGVSGSAPLVVTSATLSAVVVTPAAPRLPVGAVQQLTATGLFTDGTAQDLTADVTWSSTATAVATVSADGRATPLSAGVTTVRATGAGGVAGETALTVTPATLVSLSVTPASLALAAGTSASLVATAVYGDGTRRDVTAVAAWTATGAAAAVARGVVSALSAGPATDTATFGAAQASASITVTSATLVRLDVSPSAATVPAGQAQALTALGTFSDASTQDLTAIATWTSSAPAVAAVSNAAGTAGVVTALAAGPATITATFADVSGSAPLTVSAATLAALDVAGVPTVHAGEAVQFRATGRFSDASTRDLTAAVAWTSSSPALATVSSADGTEGLAVGLAAGGPLTVAARLGAVTGGASLTVLAPRLLAVTVSPAAESVPKGLTRAFTASGTFGDGSVQDLTAAAEWTTLDPAVALASGPVVRGEEVGVTTVQASVAGVTGAAALVVTPAVTLAVTLTPADGVLAAGTKLQYGAVAVLSDGTKVDVTASATWAAEPEAVATVFAGVVSGVAAGAATVSATSGGVTASAPLAVTAATLASIVVTPASPRLPLGVQLPLTATGLFSDGSAQDLTGQVAWDSSARGVATVSGAGVATPVSPGATTVTARLDGVSGATALVVTSATLVGVDVSPAAVTLASGTSARLRAVATYSDLTTRDVSALASWTSSAPGAAAVAGGLVSGVAAGSATITAALGGRSGTAAVDVTDAALRTLAVAPSGLTIPAGVDQPLTATGAFSDGSTQDLTALAAWTSSVTTVAAVSNAPGREGLVTGLRAGSATIAAAIGAVRGSVPLSVSAATLVSLEVEPLVTTVAVGETVRFRATGTFSDASTRDLTAAVAWSTSRPDLAAVSNGPGAEGLAAGLAAGGPLTVTARAGAVSGSAALTVAPARLLAVEVTPPSASLAAGLTQTFTATGIFGDGTTSDLTASAAWVTLDASVAVATGNVVRGEGAGVTAVEASVGGVTGSASLVVTPAVVLEVSVSPAGATLAAGTTLAYGAVAVYSDGTKRDVTATATWAPAAGPVARVASGGLATAVAPGAAAVSATWAGVTGATPLTVTAATLSSIVVSPPSPRVPLGIEQPLRAVGLFSDGSAQDLTGQASWTSSAPAVATVRAGGVATPVSVGATTVSAAVGAVTGTTTLTVTGATLAGVSVSPAAATVAAGTTARLSATATWSDLSTRDVTALALWTSSAAGIATVADGVVTAVAAGSATITATLGGRSGSAALDVTAAALEAIAVSPAGLTIPAGVDQPLTATGAFSDGSTQDVTALAAWTSSVPAVAAVSNAAGSEGRVTGLGAGTTTVAAAIGSVRGSTSLSVSAATLVSLDVEPATTTVAVAGTVAFRATGIFSDASTRDLTAEVAWSSSAPALAAVSSAAGSEGLATGLAAGGPVTVTARSGAVSATAALTVVPAALVAVAVAPSPASVAKGLTETFTATGRYADGSTADVTSSATWTTADAAVAVATGNVVRGEGVGLTTVEASVGGVTGAASLVVTPALVVAVDLAPAGAAIAAGTTLQYDAVALFTDGSRQDVTAGASWGPATGPVATAAPGGVVTGVAAGAATVTATFAGVTGQVALTVTAATLSSIVVSPAAPRLPLGVQQPFAATGLFSDGSSQDLTLQVTWTSSVPAVATLSAAGVATPVAAGETTVGATLGAVTGTTPLTVTAATLVSVAVTPGSSTFAAGTTSRYTATATYSDLTTQDVSGIASWTSSAPGVAAVDAGLATGVSAGTATLTAALGGRAGTATAEVTAAALRTLAVAPAGVSLPAGLSQQLTATGAFSDGSTQDLTASATWTSSVSTVAAVSNAPGREGLVTGLAPGETTVAAAVGVVSGSAPLTVSAATLASLEVQPATTTVPAGGTVQYRATGTFTDASTRDLTAEVAWSSSAPAVVSISSAAGSAGLARGLSAGPAAVTAQLGGVSASASLEVLAPVLVAIALAPSPASVPKGLTAAFTATGHYSDGTSQDLTGAAAWSTLDPLVAEATGNVVRGLAVGVTAVEATVGTVTGSAGLVVTAPIVTAVTLSPAAATLAAGTSVQYGAVAVYSDGTKADVTASALWAATPETIGTVAPGGLATGLAPGAATVSATALGAGGTTPLTVTAATLVSLAVTPTAPTVPLGVAQPFAATGIFTDGTREDLTTQVSWSSSAPGVATVSAAGLATPVSAGTTTITAVRGAAAASTTLTVTNATLTGLAVDQAGATIAAGTTHPFTATATYSDLSTQDATALVAWSSSSPGVATISNAPGSEGLATGLAPGVTDVSAALDGFTDLAPLTVTTAALVGIGVSPAAATLPPGATQALVATGTFADGSTQDLTALAGWTSSVGTCAAVSNAPGQEGVVTAIAAGTTTVTAAYGGRAGTAEIAVTGATVASIEVTPLTTTVPVGYTRQFRAVATYTDTTTRDVTALATWTSSSAPIATVSNAAGSQGLATGVAAGTVTLTAQLAGQAGAATLTVVSTTLQSIVVTPNPFVVTAAAGTQHTVQLRATGVFQDGERVDITRQCSWSTSSKKRATVSKGGLVTGVASAASVTISARKGPRQGSTSGQVL